MYNKIKYFLKRETTGGYGGLSLHGNPSLYFSLESHFKNFDTMCRGEPFYGGQYPPYPPKMIRIEIKVE
ncbi:MAG: hypothetical protein WC340_15685 [Kiritimatiellia bacterium]